jgi:hypothetical protein
MIVQFFIMIDNSTIQGRLDFSNLIFTKDAWFDGTTFSNNAYFNGVVFSGRAKFDGATFSRSAWFAGATFSRLAGFDGATFCEDTCFRKTAFSMLADFNKVKFSRDAYFEGASFSGNADFSKATFNSHAYFEGALFGRDASFSKATFYGFDNFGKATFCGEDLTFIKAKFNYPTTQESACRIAKNLHEKNGNRIEAGNHFFLEMEAKRKQKPWYFRYPEFILIQSMFGYGIHPGRLLYWWVLIVFIFAYIFATGNGIDEIEQWYDYIKVSLAIAIAPGYIAAIINPGSSGYRLTTGYFQLVAMLETIIGTLLWAGFIATFAKKYMK